MLIWYFVSDVQAFSEEYVPKNYFISQHKHIKSDV